MPTYQYACTECEHRFEQVQAFSDASLTECPNCGGKLRKVYGSVGVVFKGSGFYRTDSRSGASSSPGGDKSDAAASTDSKPAVKEAAASTSKATDSRSTSAPASTPAKAPSTNGSASKSVAAAK